MTVEIKQYIKEKTAVLADFNLTDEQAVQAHLESKVRETLPDDINIIRIDRIARQMIEDYWNGDRSFRKVYHEEEN